MKTIDAIILRREELRLNNKNLCAISNASKCADFVKAAFAESCALAYEITLLSSIINLNEDANKKQDALDSIQATIVILEKNRYNQNVLKMRDMEDSIRSEIAHYHYDVSKLIEQWQELNKGA